MAINKTITNSPVLLFLGAGASAPLGKAMMAEFVERVVKQGLPPDQAQLLEHLVRFRGPDLEAILGELDTITGLRYAETVDGNYRGDDGGTYSFSLKRTVAYQLTRSVKHAVIREYRNVDAAKTSEIYTPVFDAVFSHLDPEKHCLVVFTTNYAASD